MLSRNKAVNAFIVEKLLRRIGVEFHGLNKPQFEGNGLSGIISKQKTDFLVRSVLSTT